MAEDREDRWFVYVLRCRGNRLYCGIAKNVAARVAEHAAGRGAKFTRAFPPDAVLVERAVIGKSAALKEEAGFKALDRPAKDAQIRAWRG